MTEIIEAKDLPEDVKIYLKKDYFGYRIINPIKNDDGTTNWINLIFGGYRNLVLLLIILAISAFIIWSSNHDANLALSNCQNISKFIVYE